MRTLSNLMMCDNGYWCSGCGAKIPGKNETARHDWFAKHVCDPKAKAAWEKKTDGVADVKAAAKKGAAATKIKKLATKLVPTDAPVRKANEIIRANTKALNERYYTLTIEFPPYGVREDSERGKLLGFLVDAGFKGRFHEDALVRAGSFAAVRYFVKRGWLVRR